MTEEALKACLEITREFLNRPLNAFFKAPVDPEMDGLPDYLEKISHPMDLTTVKSKLENHVYQTPAEWYRDMCLIYENGVEYHTEASPWGLIAAQLLHDFKRIAAGFQAQNYHEWSEILAKETKKLGKRITVSPVRHAGDSLVAGCVKKAESMGKFRPDAIPELVDRMKALFDRNEVRHDVLTIVKTSQKKDAPITTKDDEVVIDVEKLKDQTLHALNMYTRAVE